MVLICISANGVLQSVLEKVQNLAGGSYEPGTTPEADLKHPWTRDGNEVGKSKSYIVNAPIVNNLSLNRI
ncbi:MAG TPA: hypothetical protein DIW30_04330 [Bacteroidales bacterium]|nr:hypothetical protein [Bacteroidales bacterium]